jgi:hypothetical protein
MVTKTLPIFLLVFVLALFACSPVPLPAVSPLATPSPAATPAPVTITLAEPFSLIVNQSGELTSDGLTIRFQTVLNDWRCPSKVNCAEAGNATVVLEVGLPDQEPARFELSVNPPGSQTADYDVYQIRLLELAPYPEIIDQVIPLEDYRATFEVVKQ